MKRRHVLALGGAALVGCGRCDERSDSGPGAATAPPPGWHEYSFPPGPDYADPEYAAVLAVPHAPLLIALHGAGEVRRGLAGGARGWRDYYDLDRVHQRLLAPPIVHDDLLGFVTDARLEKLNASLRAHPYRGLTVACPYTPPIGRTVAGVADFARFIEKVLIARTRKEFELATDRKQTGIDGVSMGGRIALLLGLSHPALFGAVGALQPAIGVDDAPWLSELAAKAVSTAPLALRLVSSEGDPFLAAVRALSKRLDVDGVKHQLVITPGPHDYVWNRGPGSAELLLWHERVLRGHPPP